MDLQDKNKEHIDLKSVRTIINYYPKDVDEHLVNVHSVKILVTAV